MFDRPCKEIWACSPPADPGWAGRGPCHVVTTNYRPTPLQHYMFPVGGEGLQMVVDEASTFREDSFQRVRSAKPSLLNMFWVPGWLARLPGQHLPGRRLLAGLRSHCSQLQGTRGCRACRSVGAASSARNPSRGSTQPLLPRVSSWKAHHAVCLNRVGHRMAVNEHSTFCERLLSAGMLGHSQRTILQTVSLHQACCLWPACHRFRTSVEEVHV